MTTMTMRNGVDVDRLVATVGAIRENPELAKFQFRSHTEWQGGARTVTRIKEFFGAGQEDTSRGATFEVTGDEPAVLLGNNTAPNAVEAVLGALASCIAVGYVYNAAARGIEIEALTFDITGDLDLQGFLGLSEAVRPGFSNIAFNYRVKSPAPREQLEALCEYVQRTSPVLDIIRNPVPVAITLTAAERIIDCPCGHQLRGADDDVLFVLAREHIVGEHPEMQRTDAELRERIRMDSRDA